MRKPLDAPHRPLLVELPITVRTYDIDFAGHVSNIAYIRWLEDLRVAIMTAHYPLDRQRQDGIGPILTQTHIDYKRPILLFDRPVSRMWVSSLGAVKIVIDAEFEVAGQIVAAAQQTGCFVSLETGRPIRVPEPFKQALGAGEP